MARLLLTTVFNGSLVHRGSGLFESGFGDWRIYAYGATGGIGFVLVSEGRRVRRFAERLAKPS
jgi:hypothetical protein